MPVSSSTEHWIKPDALTINLNHFGDPDYLQVSVLAGAVVMAFKQDVIGYNAAHNYRTWPLEAANTYLETSSAYNVYARLTRSEVNARALIVYDTVLRDIEGREISYANDDSEQVGESDPEFFYIFLGQISGSINNLGEKVNREWTTTLRFGVLDTTKQKNDLGLLFNQMFVPHFDNPNNPEELTWIEALSNLCVAGGITSYLDNKKLNLPSIYDGLPIDWSTIYWEEVKDSDGNVTGRVLKAAAGSSSEGGDVVVSGITVEQLAAYLATNKYATQPWVEGKGYLTAITSAMVTGALGFTPFDAASFTKANIKSKLGIADWALASNKPSYTFAEILSKPTTVGGYGITDAYKYVQVVGTNPTTQTWYFPVWTSGALGGTNYDLRANNGFRYLCMEGSTTEDGYSLLALGNNVASGTEGNKYGMLRIFNTSSGSITIRPGGGNTTNRNLYLPHDVNGQFVVHSNDEQIGTSHRPVYISKQGIAMACTIVAGTSGTRPIVVATDDHQFYKVDTILANYATGTIVSKTTGGTGLSHRVENDNGSVGIHVQYNQGLYDYSNSKWLVGSDRTNTWFEVGNVGVGTASPKHKFHVVGEGWIDGYLYATRFVVPSGSTYSRLSIFGAENTNSIWIQAGAYDGSAPAGVLNLSGINANALAELKMLATKTTISGTLDVGGVTSVPSLKVNGGSLTYDKTNKYWKLEGDLLVTGGVTTHASDSAFKPSTIMDALLLDSTTLGINTNGQLYVKGGTGGSGLDEDSLASYLLSNMFVNKVSVSGSGNAVTAASISGHTLTLTKGSTFALASDLSSYAKKSTTLSGYGITNAYTKTEADGKYLVKSNGEYYGIDFNSTLEDGNVRILLKNGGNTRVGVGYSSSKAYFTNYVTGKELLISDKLNFNGEGVFESLYVGGKTLAKGGIEVTGAAYFGGGTTYYFGSTGNVKCGKLDTTGVATIASTFTASTNAYFGGELRSIAPEGATYAPWRIIHTDEGLYIQAATKDGTNVKGKLHLTGLGAQKLELLRFLSDATEVNGKLSVEGVLTSKVADGTAPMVITSTTKVANLNADMVDDFSVTTNGMLYRSIKSASDTSGEIWYLKVKFDRGWNSGLQHIEVSADYNNTNGKVLLELDSYNHDFGFRAKVSSYNNCNCTGFCHSNDASEGIGYLYLRFVGYSSAYAQIKSTLVIDSVTKIDATEAATIAWKELSPKVIRSNYKHIFDWDVVLGGNFKTLYDNKEYITFQNHNNGNISLSAATGDLYLGYVNTKSVVSQTSLIPASNNALSLGSSAKQWNVLYAKSLNLNGGIITYDVTNKVFEIQGDVVVKGGVTTHSSLTAFTPSTIMDGVLVDGTTIKKDANGRLYVVGCSSSGGGMDEDALASYLLANNYIKSITTSGSGNAITGVSQSGSGLTFTKGSTFALASALDSYQTKITSSNKLAYSLISGTPTSLKNPTALTFGTKTYDGSSAATITASDLGALTSHQSIYNLTLQAGTFTAKTFDPNGAAQTVNIPTTTAHISESGNLYFTNARALAAITGGASTIKDTNLTASRALISNASGKVAVSAVTSTELGYLGGVTSAIQTQINGKAAKATTLAGYGITDAYTKTESGDTFVNKGSNLNASNVNFDTLQSSAIYFNATGNGTGNTNTPEGYGLMFVFGNGGYTSQLHVSADNVVKVRTRWYRGGSFGWNDWHILANTSLKTTFKDNLSTDKDLSVKGASSFTGAASYNGGLNILNGSTLLISSGKVVYANQQVMYGTNTSGTYEACLYPRWADATYLNYGSKGFNIRNNSSVLTMHMTNDNKVGIGTNAPTQELHVNGNILSKVVYFANGTTYYLGSTGNINCNTLTANGATTLKSTLGVTGAVTMESNLLVKGHVTSYSQRSLKNVIDERGLSLEELATIKPTRYTWKDGRDELVHIGGIADDVQKVLPEVVFDNNGTLTMDYAMAGFAIAASLIKPVAKHEEDIESLKNRIKELEKEVERLTMN